MELCELAWYLDRLGDEMEKKPSKGFRFFLARIETFGSRETRLIAEFHADDSLEAMLVKPLRKIAVKFDERSPKSFEQALDLVQSFDPSQHFNWDREPFTKNLVFETEVL